MALYTPRRRRTRLNWSAGPTNWAADPLYGVNKADITPQQSAAGLEYRKRLYAPGSPEMAALFGQTPKPRYPTGWVGQRTPIRPGMYTLPNGGVASVSSASAAPRAVAVTPEVPPMPPSFAEDDSGAGGKRLEQFLPGQSGALQAGLPAPGETGAAGPVGTEAPTSPMLGTPPPAVESPYLANPGTAGGSAGAALVGAGASMAGPDMQNPLNLHPVEDPMNPRRGVSMQGGMAPGNQRRYRDTTGRIDARATVSPQDATPAPVQFKNEVPGHSDWQPY